MLEKQELHCHDCGRYVQFELDMELNGNHVLNCPNCGHEHCRVIKDGKITSDRWDQRNIDWTYRVTAGSSTTTSVYDSFAGSFIGNSWANASTATGTNGHYVFI